MTTAGLRSITGISILLLPYAFFAIALYQFFCTTVLPADSMLLFVASLLPCTLCAILLKIRLRKRDSANDSIGTLVKGILLVAGICFGIIYWLIYFEGLLKAALAD
jgi:hypothetical protein